MKRCETDTFSVVELLDEMSEEASARIEIGAEQAALTRNRISDVMCDVYELADPSNQDEVCYTGLVMAAVFRALMQKKE